MTIDEIRNKLTVQLCAINILQHWSTAAPTAEHIKQIKSPEYCLSGHFLLLKGYTVFENNPKLWYGESSYR